MPKKKNNKNKDKKTTFKKLTIVKKQILKGFCDFNICNMYYIY